MAEGVERSHEQKAKTETAAKEVAFVDEGFEVSEAPLCSEAETAAAKGSKKFVDEDSKSPEYRSDEWRMKNFKVVQCSKRYAHDWTICPFAHPGEKARRRDPKVHSYDGVACPDMKKAGFCGRGDSCPYAHNVFEYWLHPTRYRTQLCKDGTSCSRHVCFFAHTMQEMRPLTAKGPTSETKKPTHRDGQTTPDTPLMTGSSEHTASSASSVSAELWNTLTEERMRQSTALSEDSGPKKDKSGSIDDVMYNLANVKLAMSGDKQTEVIKLLQQLLQDLVEEKQRDMKAPPTSRPKDLDVAGTLRGLNLQQAQALLAAAQGKPYQVSETSPRRYSHDWPRTLQEVKRESCYPPSSQGRIGSDKAIGSTEALYTAPAGLEQSNPASASMPPNASLEAFKAPDVPSRMFSADLGLPPAYYAQPLSLWQQSALERLPQQQSRQSSMSLYPGMGNETEHTTSLAPSSFWEPGFGSDFAAPANPSALRRQPVNLQETMAPAKRERSRPPISAFQSASTQEWKSTPGRGVSSSDLSWASSARASQDLRASQELNAISEGLQQYNRAQQDLLNQQQRASMDASLARLGSRSHSTSYGGLDAAGFNHMSTPLTYAGHHQGPTKPSALHSAPFDLNFAYSAGLDAHPAGNPSGPPAPPRTSYDRSAFLQGWGGMNACDFGGGKY